MTELLQIEFLLDLKYYHLKYYNTVIDILPQTTTNQILFILNDFFLKLLILL